MRSDRSCNKIPKGVKMKIISWNVNGLRAIVKKEFIKQIYEMNADIIGLQETKIQSNQIPEEMNELTQYHQYWDYAEKKGYSGVSLLSKQKPVSVSNSIGNLSFEKEGRINCADYGSFLLFNIYFPNGQMNEDRLKYKLEFYDQFLDFIEEKRKEGKHIIVGGDFNTAHKEIDLANPKENEKYSGFLPIERAWLDKLIEKGYIDTFRQFNPNPDEYSWWSYRLRARERNVGWRIDYFFVNNELLPYLKNAFILQDVTGSDHCPVGIEIDLPGKLV